MENDDEDRLVFSTPSLTPHVSESSGTQTTQNMENINHECESESEVQDQQPTEATDDDKSSFDQPDQARKDPVETTLNMTLHPQVSHDRDDICSPSTDVEPSVDDFTDVASDLDTFLENKSLDPENLTCRESLCEPFLDETDEITILKQTTINTTTTTITTTFDTDYVKPKLGKNDIGHIMISYNHSTKQLCSRIARALKDLHYPVWIDEDDISGDIFTSMASAVENSFLVLMAINEQYHQSRYCRLEAEYSVERNKASIPMLMQPGYKPSGWLGFINGSKLHIDFSNLQFDEAFHLLLREIEAVRTNLGADHIDRTQISTMSSESMTTMNTSWNYHSTVHDWNADDVIEWLNRQKLEIFEGVLTGFTGDTLWQLYKIRSESAADYYRMIESLLPPTIPLRLFYNLTFNAALETLFPSSNQKIHR